MEEYILPIKTQIVRDALTTTVQEAITDKGFVLKKTQGTFIQKTSTGFNSISVVVTGYNWPVYVQAGLVFGVRYDIVEEIYSRFMKMPFGDYKEADKKYWDSVGGRASFNNNYTSWDDNITSDFKEDILKNTSLVITKEEHLPHAKQKFVEALDEYAFPFFEKYKDINAFVEHELTSYYLQYKERKWAFSIQNVIYMLIVLKVTRNPLYEYYKNDMLEILEMQKKNPAIRVEEKEAEDILYDCIAYLQTL